MYRELVADHAVAVSGRMPLFLMYCVSCCGTSASTADAREPGLCCAVHMNRHKMCVSFIVNWVVGVKNSIPVCSLEMVQIGQCLSRQLPNRISIYGQ